MIINCSILLICIVAVILTLLICLSKRQLNALTLALFIGGIFTVVLYFLIKDNVFMLESMCELVNKVFVKFKINLSKETLVAFVNCFSLIIFFAFVFVVFEFVFSKVARTFDQIVIKNKKYYIVKSLLVSIDIIVFSVVVFFAIGTLNIVYGMKEGLFSFAFELVKKGIYAL